MVSDSELTDRLTEILGVADLNTTTPATIRRKLEEDFNVDLSDKKSFIREHIDCFIRSQEENFEEDEDDGDDGDQTVEVKSEGIQDSNSYEEEDDEAKRNQKNTKKRRSNKPDNEVKKRGGGGFTKLCSLSPKLQDFVGVPELARTEVVKQIWAYIREKQLQDPNNRRTIICDESLRALFEVESIDMFQMNKALAAHIWPLGSDGADSAKPTEKKKKPKQEREDSDEPKKKKKRQSSGGSSGFLAPLRLSDPLIKFLGTGESELSRSEVVKRIWNYIKQNNLQDPSDKRIILSDEKLKELFDVESFNGFTVSKLLVTHFLKS